MSGKFSVRVESFKPMRSNTLFGFVDIAIPEITFEIIEATVHQSGDRRWIGLPGKPQLSKEGCVLLDGRGKRLYTPTIKITDKRIGAAFSDRVIERLLERFPNAFNLET
jgi:hypothetical protein